MEAWVIKKEEGTFFWGFDDDNENTFGILLFANFYFTKQNAQSDIDFYKLKGCKPVKVEIKECSKKKRIETMVDLFAHLITRNDDRPFNKVWEMYFGNMNLEHKNIEEVEAWLNEEVENG